MERGEGVGGGPMEDEHIIKANNQASPSQKMASCHLDLAKGKTIWPGEDEMDIDDRRFNCKQISRNKLI